MDYADIVEKGEYWEEEEEKDNDEKNNDNI